MQLWHRFVDMPFAVEVWAPDLRTSTNTERCGTVGNGGGRSPMGPVPIFALQRTSTCASS